MDKYDIIITDRGDLMYQALYRKYRPKTLDDVCGQDVIVKIIKNSILNNQINHAYLFAGPRGTGKTSVAKIFAKIINCEHPVDCKPCGKCVSCTQENNSDIIEIDAASNNGVDEIRELRNKVNLLPAYGKYKVYIIDEVHMLTQGAFNALLKTLEEPPAHVIFILATTDSHKVLETILSRCQRLDFKKISNEAIVENLSKIAKKENIDIDKEALNEIAKLADGGMRDSVGMLDQARAYTEGKITVNDIHDINGTLTEKDLKELLENIIDNKLDIILEKIDEYNDKGKNFVKLIEEFIDFIRNIILFKEAPNYFKERVQNIENYEEISPKISINTLFSIIETLNKYSFEMKNNNNSKLLFELAFIKIISEKNIEIVEKSSKITKKSEEMLEKQTNILKNSQKTEKNVENSTQNVEKEEKIQTKTEQDTDVIIKNELESPTLETNSSKKTQTKKINTKLKENIEKIKKIRIDNTLAKFNKKEVRNITRALELLNDLLLDPDYSNGASILLDGILKAASDENLIFVYKTKRLSDIFNENLPILEETIAKILNKKYNLIATDLDEWEIIKKDFNNKLRPFIYKEEQFNIEDFFKEDEPEDNITSMFEDIIEYN